MSIDRESGDFRRYNIPMLRLISLLLLSISFGGWATAQQQSTPGPNQEPPRSERNKVAGESSSRDSRIDLSPPKDDAKNHPNSGAAVSDALRWECSGRGQDGGFGGDGHERAPLAGNLRDPIA